MQPGTELGGKKEVVQTTGGYLSETECSFFWPRQNSRKVFSSPNQVPDRFED